MGVGNSKKRETPVEAPPKAGDIRTLLEICKKKLSLFRNKKVHSIINKKNEVIDYLKKRNLEFAKTKMESIKRDEDAIDSYDILGPLLEILTEKIYYIESSSECPPDIRAQLDTIIYSSSRIEIEDFLALRDIFRRKYGLNYITKAENNEDKLINQNLIDKLQIKVYSEAFLMLRLKQLAKEKKENFDFLDDSSEIPGNFVEPVGGQDINPYEDNNNYNPYGQPSNFGQQQNNNNPYGPSQDFGNQNESPQNDFNPYGPSQNFDNQNGCPQDNNNPYGP